MQHWRLLFFSTGEKSIKQMLAQVGQTQKGGQRVRLPDIPADDGGSGSPSIIVETNGLPSKDFVRKLKTSCANYYGLAGPVFATYLLAEAQKSDMGELAAELREDLYEMEKTLIKDHQNNEKIKLPREGERVLRRFALVALAGARAAKAGIIDWTLVDILKSVMDVRDRWLSEQGTERSETDRALSYFRDQIMKNVGRFLPFDANPNQGQKDLLGFRVPDYFLLTSDSLDELAGEHDRKTLLNLLKAEGFLWHDNGRLTKKAPKTASLGNIRPNLYWIALEFIGEIDAMNTESDVKSGAAEQVDLALGVSQETTRKLGKDEPIPF